MTSFLADRTRFWAETLTRIPSITGTADEAAFADRLVDLLRASPALAQAPNLVWTIPVPGGRHPRKCVLALLPGRGRDCVVLTGHFDTVETASYGDLQPLALDPVPLREALIQKLETEPATTQTSLALTDFRSGDYLPGRGLLDMKAGLAAAIAVIEDAAQSADRTGNLLFVAVPDEEAYSAGARAFAAASEGVAREHNLQFRAAINLDAIADNGDGRAARAAGLGTIGKLLPTALVVGLPIHASYTFRGLNAAALAGAIAAEMEWATDLTEEVEGELLGGPSLLEMRDSKTAYDVTTPQSVWLAWNVATWLRSPAEVLDAVTGHVRTAVDTCAAALEQRRVALGAEGTTPPVHVLTFEELAAPNFATVQAFADTLGDSGLDLPTQCRRITEEAWRLSGRSGPAVILGFGSTPYLAVKLGTGADARRLDQLIRDLAVSDAEHFTTRPFFPAISDVSFLGEADGQSLDLVGRNTPVWHAALAWPDGSPVAGIPSVNIGPWGRDYHSPLERLHLPYATEHLPRLLAMLSRRLLERVVG